MPHYRRAFIPGGTFFFTVVTEQRARILCQEPARKFLGKALRDCRERWPFQIDALVLLPDHLHAIWTLPPGDIHYSRRWAWIKKEFSKAWLSSGGVEREISESRIQHRRRGIWQPRFWEHTIKDENDYARHFDYVHWNPVKHDLAQSVCDWPFSTFHRWVRLGVYSRHWGGQGAEPLDFSDLEDSAME
jgi:putative transposase